MAAVPVSISDMLSKAWIATHVAGSRFSDLFFSADLGAEAKLGFQKQCFGGSVVSLVSFLEERVFFCSLLVSAYPAVPR